MTITGEKSNPPKLIGNLLRMLYRTGSVTLCRNLTIELYGSGLTHEIIALPIIIHIYSVKPIFNIFATATKKLDKTNIFSLKIGDDVKAGRKPGFVPRICHHLRGDGHSSIPNIAIGVKRPTRELGRAALKRPPTWSCSVWGLPCLQCHH